MFQESLPNRSTRLFNVFVLGAHTNTIEGAWRHAKAFVRRKRPQTKVRLQALLYQYMWFKWRATTWPGGSISQAAGRNKNSPLYYC
jgi:hypothetical protein